MLRCVLNILCCGQCPTNTAKYRNQYSRSHTMLMVSLYNMDYQITDKLSGELVDCDLIDYNEQDHNLHINNHTIIPEFYN